MDLTVRTEGFDQDDQSWLGSSHGTDSAFPVTLDMSKFTAGTHFPNGYLPSGTALGKLTAQFNGVDMYGPYNASASDGTQTFVGYTLTVTKVNTATSRPKAPLHWHGRVISARRRFQTGAGAIDAAGKTAAVRFLHS